MARKSAASGSELSAAFRVAVLHGKELFLQTEKTAQLREALREKFGEVDTIRFDGATAPAATVLDECRTFGLMQQHKLVVVDNADQFVKEANRPLVERYAANPSDGATLVLRCEKWNKGNLDKLIAKVGAMVECDPVSDQRAIAWAADRAREVYGVELDADAGALLVERLGPGLARIDTELAKLAVSGLGEDGGKPVPAGPGGGGRKAGTKEHRPEGRCHRITRAAVAELVGTTREEEFWGIQERLLGGDPREALGHLRAILENGPRDASVPVSYACIDLARKLHGIAQGLRQGMNPWTVAGKLKIWPESRRDAIIGCAKRMSVRDAAGLLQAAVEADVAQKTGLGRPDRTLEVLALRFTGR